MCPFTQQMGTLNSICMLEVPGELDKLSAHQEGGKRQNNEVIKKNNHGNDQGL